MDPTSDGEGRCRLGSFSRNTQTAKEFDLSVTDARSGDAELLEALRAASLPAFERLFAEQGDRMKSVAANLLGNLTDAEDAVQEAMLKAYRSAARFRGSASPSTWLHRILVNTCYDFLRKRRRRAEEPLPVFSETVSAARPEDHPLRLSIEKALLGLEPPERAAFLLCEVEGFSHREAGEILEVSEARSRALLFRAKRRVQKSLAAAGAFLPAEAP